MVMIGESSLRRSARKVAVRHPLEEAAGADDDSGVFGSSDLDSGADDDSGHATAQLYCICRKPDDGELMVQCDACSQWFHAACMRLSEKTVTDDWKCPTCVSSRSERPPQSASTRNVDPPATGPAREEAGHAGIPAKDRDSCRTALCKVISQDLASAVEDAVLHTVAGEARLAEASKLYKAKMREILFNLKSNTKLRQSLTEGVLSPASLAAKDVSLLADPELIASRNEERRQSLTSRLKVAEEEEDELQASVRPQTLPAAQADIVLAGNPAVELLSPPSDPAVKESDVARPNVSEVPDEMDAIEIDETPVMEPPETLSYQESLTAETSQYDWTGTLAVTATDPGFRLRGNITEPGTANDRKRLSKLPSALYVHGRINPSAVHKFIMQVHAVAVSVPEAERHRHKRIVLVEYFLPPDSPADEANCALFIKQYRDRARIPVLDFVDQGILLYFVSPVFHSNAIWSGLLMEVFGRDQPPAGTALWAIAVLAAESKLPSVKKTAIKPQKPTSQQPPSSVAPVVDGAASGGAVPPAVVERAAAQPPTGDPVNRATPSTSYPQQASSQPAGLHQVADAYPPEHSYGMHQAYPSQYHDDYRGYGYAQYYQQDHYAYQPGHQHYLPPDPAYPQHYDRVRQHRYRSDVPYVPSTTGGYRSHGSPPRRSGPRGHPYSKR
ncbi:PHD-type domain-containing protein [Plasmodiophora brassicae]